jgi:hypothetical protein
VGSLEGEVAQDCPMCRSVIGHLQLVDKQKD